MSHLWPAFIVNVMSSLWALKPEVEVGLSRPDSHAVAHTYPAAALLPKEEFAHALELERKRTERSRRSFLLLLLDIDPAGEENGGRDRLIQQLLGAVTSFARETDVRGWHREDSVVGLIFTELGDAEQELNAERFILARVQAALEQHLGSEKCRRIGVSWLRFPDDWNHTRPGGRVDSRLYPDLAVQQRPSWRNSLGKRLLDITGSASALILLAPIFMIVVLAVKLTSPGPVFYCQKRVGRYGKRFTFVKFRSMHVANDSCVHERYVRDLITGTLEEPEDGVYKIQQDPRVTTVGHWLRKTSLDELPQFWNVLIGDMSLVGPRPPLPYEVEVYDTWHRRRLLEVKPGITGLWQIAGRSRTSFDDMVRLDLRYARLCSFGLDFKILLQTPRAMLAGDGAY